MGNRTKKGKNSIYMVIAVFCAAFLLLSVLFMQYVTVQNQREVQEYMGDVAEQSKSTVQKQIIGDFQTLNGIASIIGSMEDVDFEALLPTLEEINKNNSFIRMGFTERDGKTMGADVYSTTYSDVDLSDKGFVERAYAGENVITNTQKAEIGDFLVNFMAVPIIRDGEVVRVLCGVNRSDVLQEITDASIFGGKGFASIIDSNGEYVIRSMHPSVNQTTGNIFENGPFTSEEETRMKRDMAEDKSGFIEYPYGESERWASYTPVEINDWYIFSVVSRETINQNFTLVTGGMIAIIAGAVAIFCIFVLLINRMNNRSERALERLAYRDALTGSRNYYKFLIDAKEILKNKEDRRYAVLYVDIKNFKYLNYLFGYDVGDNILKYWAEKVEEDTREEELFGRVFADNFVGLQSYREEKEIATRIQQIGILLEEYPETAENGFKIEISAGVYLLNKQDGDLALVDMVDRANVAQKSIKGTVATSVAFYSNSMREQVLKETEIGMREEYALRKGEFEVYIQPKIDIQNGNKVTGGEALVRWNWEGRGLISPMDFIPLFERNGFILKLDKYVFETVCKNLRRNLDQQPEVPVISVNVSRLCVMQLDFAQTYVRIKNEYKIPDHMIELEFTESIAFENHVLFRNVVKNLQENGFLCSMDDFGAGQSSLNILKNLPVNTLKLDMLFFRESKDKARDRELIGGIISMAKALQMSTVAEGVEDIDQVRFLREVGCDLVQGYVFSKPLTISAFEEFVKNHLPFEDEE